MHLFPPVWWTRHSVPSAQPAEMPSPRRSARNSQSLKTCRLCASLPSTPLCGLHAFPCHLFLCPKGLLVTPEFSLTFLPCPSTHGRGQGVGRGGWMLSPLPTLEMQSIREAAQNKVTILMTKVVTPSLPRDTVEAAFHLF